MTLAVVIFSAGIVAQFGLLAWAHLRTIRSICRARVER